MRILIRYKAFKNQYYDYGNNDDLVIPFAFHK
jgi:hypothetical protein